MTKEEKKRIIRQESRVTVNRLLRESFDRVDRDKDGLVGVNDIRVGLSKAGVQLSKEEAIDLVSRMKGGGELDGPATVTYDEFCRAHEEFLHHVFKTFDEDKKGYLDVKAIQHALHKMGMIVTTEEAENMIHQIHPYKTKLSMDDFQDLYLVMRARMYASPKLETFMWDPDVQQFSTWWKSTSIMVGESGLRAPIPVRKGKKEISSGIRFLAGAFSGVVEALILTPLDVTKTRLQLDTSGRYRGMIDCGMKLFQSEGFFALYKGLAPWTLHVVAKNGTRFYFIDVYRKLLSDQNGQVSGTREFIAGGLAGATEAVLIVTPFEVIKTRLQGQDCDGKSKAKYNGLFQTAKQITSKEGPFALWKGCTPTIARQGLNQACSFWTNNAIKKYVWDVHEGDSIAPWKSVLTGMLGAIPGPCINSPMDVVKTRLMAQENAKGEVPKYKGAWHALRTIPKEEGIKALYKGLIPRLSRLCPSYGIQWLVMDQVTAHFANK